MKVSDYILNFLSQNGTHHVFLMTGGAIMFVIDSFKGRKDINYICIQHEQAAAMAADAYSRVGKGIGTAMTTSGPGATNLVTGICCSWFDSIPTLFITGQVNTNESARDLRVRQIGFQETDIIAICKPVTKYAAYVDNPESIRFHLEKAIYLAQHGRPGPVLIDIPMNVQRAEINPHKLKSYQPKVKNISAKEIYPLNDQKIRKILVLLKQSSRPVIICGGGVRSAMALKQLQRFAEYFGIPIALTLRGIDCLPFSHSLHAGFFGTYGLRGANFTIANADFVLCLGSRLDVRQTGTSPDSFAREAKKIVVDIDPEEINKRVKADIAISCDVKKVLEELLKKKKTIKCADYSQWRSKVHEWKIKYPACPPEYYKKAEVNPYVFMKALSDAAPAGEIIIGDTGANLMWELQTWELKKDQRLFSAGGMSPMGYALPAAIGASVALKNKRIICTIGDGGMQLNIQELQTIAYHKLPIKIFIINNRCYGMIKQFQRLYLKNNFQATDCQSGYGTPDFIKAAEAYGLESSLIKSHKDLKNRLKKIIDKPGPVICDIRIDTDNLIIPKLEVFHPIEDAIPYLPRKEFLSNMIVQPYQKP